MEYTKITTQGFSYAHDSTTTNNFDKDGYWGNILKTNVAYNINSKLTINARCLYSSYKTLSDADDFIDDKYLYYKNRIVTTGAGFDYKSNKWLIVGNYQYANNLRGYYFSSTNHENYGGTLHSADILVTNKLTQHFTLLLGVNYKFGHLKYYSFDSAAGTNFIPYANTHQYSLYGYLSYKTNEGYLKALNLADKTQMHTWFKHNFTEWGDVWGELFENAETPFMPIPIYCMPLDQTWQALPNVTLLGDAAHLMPPFAGEGVNMSMLDALELTESLTAGKYGYLHEAISFYEINMTIFVFIQV